MYPNPQDAVPLPPRPSLEQYRKQAKGLVRACRSGDPDAVAVWVDGWLGRIARLQPPKVRRRERAWIEGRADQLEEFIRRRLSGGGKPAAKRPLTLTEAQFMIARALGFPSWPKLARH